MDSSYRFVFGDWEGSRRLVAYEGPYGPASVRYGENLETTEVVGDFLEGFLQAGPALRYDDDFKSAHSFAVSGSVHGEGFRVVQEDRRSKETRSLEISSDSWVYHMRASRFGSEYVRGDGSPVEVPFRFVSLFGLRPRQRFMPDAVPREVVLRILIRASSLHTRMSRRDLF